MAEPAGIAHSDLVQDLRLLREKGLLRLRGLELPVLNAAARAAGLNSASDPNPTAVERLLRRAVEALGDEEPGLAAQYLFGLVRGTAGRRPTDLRESAAKVYEVSPETFRKERERLLVARIADEILALCHPLPTSFPSPHPEADAPQFHSRAHPSDDEVPGEPDPLDEERYTKPSASITIGRDQYLAGRDQVIVHGDQITYVQIIQVPGETSESVRTALPPDTLAFIGRDDELRQILGSAMQGVDAGTGGVVAIHAIDGMPGVGKTALAIHAAHLLTIDALGRPSTRFPDGQLFVDLRAHTPGQEATSPADALAALLIGDGVDPRYLPETIDGRSAMWRERLTGRRVLLVLDNAADSAQVSPLIPGQPGCFTLITSRRRLGDLPGGANILALDVLKPHQARAMFLNLAVQARKSGRAVTQRGVDELVALAAYLPLAISLLARVFTHHRTWTIHDLLNETRTRLLTLNAEYTTVAAAFDLSYEFLPPERQQFFRRIGLHPGVDLDAEAAATLGGTSREEAISFLDALHLDHLVIEVSYRRYGLHDLIRTYLMARAAQDPQPEREQALTRLLDYYQRVAELSGNYLSRQTRPRRRDNVVPLAIQPRGGEQEESPRSLAATSTDNRFGPEVNAPDLADRAQALAWVRTERPNLLACIALARTFEPARLVALTAALSDLLRLDGPWGNAALLHAAAAEVARGHGDWFGEAEALTNLGQVKFLSGDLSGGTIALARARLLFDKSGNRLGRANAMSGEAGIEFRNANYTQAADAWEQVLNLYQALEDRLGEANTLTDLGNVRYRIGDAAGASTAMEQALFLHMSLGNPEGEALALTNLAIVHYRTGKLADAAQALTRAVELCQRIGDRRGEANALTYLGAVLRLTGDYQGVIEALTPALDLHRELGHQLGVANTLLYLGSARLLTGDSLGAARMLNQTLKLYQDLKDPLGEANTYLYLGVLHRGDGDLRSAQTHLQRSLDLYREIRDSGGEAESLNETGTLCRMQGDLERAMAHHREALELSRRIDSAWDEAHALAGLARCAQATGGINDAASGLLEAMNIFRRIGVAEADVIVLELETLASTHHALGIPLTNTD